MKLNIREIPQGVTCSRNDKIVGVYDKSFRWNVCHFRAMPTKANDIKELFFFLSFFPRFLVILAILQCARIDSHLNSNLVYNVCGVGVRKGLWRLRSFGKGAAIATSQVGQM